MIGILVEKSSAAKNFAKALGGMTGTYNGEPYVIVASNGHLYEYKYPEYQVVPALASQYKSWDVANLPWDEKDLKWEREVRREDKAEKRERTAGIIKNIKDTLSKCDEIVIATDIDASGEGDLLAWEVLDELQFRPKKFSRMDFIDEAPRSLQTAFVQRRHVQSMRTDANYLRAEHRARFDYLTMQFTRIAKVCGDGSTTLRQGRLKSSMVLIVGDGLKTLAGYKKIPFYQNRFRDENGVCYGNPDEQMFPDKNQVPQTYLPSNVIVDSTAMKATPPPRLLDLAGLASMLANRGVKTTDVLATYQKLYEAQIVSYPRTDDKHISPEQFQELLPLVDDIARIVGADVSKLTHRTPRGTHVRTGGAHGANRPGINVPSSLVSLTSYGSCAPMIYEILAKNYLATLAEDYEYEAQKGHLETYPAFIGTANVPKKLGWKAVFSDADDDALEDSNTSGLGTKASPYIHEGFPPKPPTPTMKWLMAQLEKYDVGTGATRAETYSKITDDSPKKSPLLRDTKGKLTMTRSGEMSYRLLPGTHIGDLKFTEELQADMRAIAEGKITSAECLARMQQYVRDDIAVMSANGVIMRKELGITMDTKTPSVDKEKCEGTWNGKPCSFNRVYCGHRFTDDECRQLLAGETIPVNGLVSKSGSKYNVIGKLANLVYKGHPHIGFERMSFGIPDSWSGHVFTEDEKTMLLDGKAVQLNNVLSAKTGKTFSCKMTWAKPDDGKDMKLIPIFR